MKIKRYSLTFLLLFIALSCAIVFALRMSIQGIALVDYTKLDLPILSIHTDANKMVKSKEDYRKADFTFTDGNTKLSGRCKIRGHGNSTWKTIDTSKRSYLVKFDETVSLLGMPQAQKWLLVSNNTDKTSLRNAYAMYLGTFLFNHMPWTPEQHFISVVINEKFLGLYLLSEKIELDEHRIKLPKGSFLAEVNSRMNREWNFETRRGTELSIRKPDEQWELTEPQTTQWYQQSQNILCSIEETIYSSDFTNPDTGWRSVLDEDSFIDWYLINEFVKNTDAAFSASCYMYYDSEKQKLFMGPIWDFDISAGNAYKYDCDKPEGFHILYDTWYTQLMTDPYFAAKVAQRWRQVDVEQSIHWLTSQAEAIRDAVEINELIWRRFGKRQWPNAPGWQNRKTYQDEIDYMIDWLQQRKAWLDTQYA